MHLTFCLLLKNRTAMSCTPIDSIDSFYLIVMGALVRFTESTYSYPRQSRAENKNGAIAGLTPIGNLFLPASHKPSATASATQVLCKWGTVDLMAFYNES